jgi:hypothetical protein
VTWNTSDGVFRAKTTYSATVKLTAASGYTFTGFTGSFTHGDAISGGVSNGGDPTNAAGIGIVFKPTSDMQAEPITGEDLKPYLPAPVTGGTPANAVEGAQYRGWVEWARTDNGGAVALFEADTSYTATVRLTAASGWTFDGVPASTEPGGFTYTDAVSVSHAENSGEVTIVFKKTGGVVFSGSSLVDGDSAIDAIRRAVDLWEVSVTWNGAFEEVRLDADTDLGENGLVLESGNSPDRVVISLSSPRTIAWNVTGTDNTKPLITVGDGVTLVLRNITFEGTPNTTNRASLIQVNSGGTLIMERGARLTGNRVRVGGGVNVASGGKFTMNDGTIDHNTATSRGGGVNVDTGGEFTMNYGTISGNTARIGGGVAVQYSWFTKKGGTIYGAKKENSAEDEVNGMKNITTSSSPTSVGNAAVYSSTPPPTFIRDRNTTAGPTIDLDGSTPENWEVL